MNFIQDHDGIMMPEEQHYAAHYDAPYTLLNFIQDHEVLGYSHDHRMRLRDRFVAAWIRRRLASARPINFAEFELYLKLELPSYDQAHKSNLHSQLIQAFFKIAPGLRFDLGRTGRRARRARRIRAARPARAGQAGELAPVPI